MLSEKLLKQSAEEFALVMNESLPKPEQCQHVIFTIQEL